MKFLVLASTVGAAFCAFKCQIQYSSDDCSGDITQTYIRHDGDCSDSNINMCNEDLTNYTVTQFDTADTSCDGQAAHVSTIRTPLCNNYTSTSFWSFCSTNSECTR